MSKTERIELLKWEAEKQEDLVEKARLAAEAAHEYWRLQLEIAIGKWKRYEEAAGITEEAGDE